MAQAIRDLKKQGAKNRIINESLKLAMARIHQLREEKRIEEESRKSLKK